MKGIVRVEINNFLMKNVLEWIKAVMDSPYFWETVIAVTMVVSMVTLGVCIGIYKQIP